MFVRVARSLRGSTTVAAFSRVTTAASGSNSVATYLPQPPALHLHNAIQTRTQSSATNSGIQRAYPQYAVHGESHMLCVKMIVPGYRIIKGNSLVIDNARKGRMLFEFTPRGSDGSYVWTDQVRFALSAEEAGLFCNQLPQYPVELSRSGGGAAVNGEDGSDAARFSAVSNDMPDKVLRITPAEGASVSFLLDFVRDGVGGQSPGLGQDGARPTEVVTQAGEFEVILSIMKSSLPILAGWSPLVDYAVQASINEAVSGGYGGGSGPPSSAEGRFSGGGISGGGVPF